MKIKILLVAVTICSSVASVAAVPVFENPVLISASVKAIADPFVADWDGDGLQDLIVGQFNPHRVRWFKNTGSVGNPVFKDMDFLKADGEIIDIESY